VLVGGAVLVNVGVFVGVKVAVAVGVELGVHVMVGAIRVPGVLDRSSNNVRVYAPVAVVVSRPKRVARMVNSPDSKM
jgi:hypothetical protein